MSKKLGASNLVFQAFEGFIGTKKQEKNFNSREGFFRKSPFCTFYCINPGFGGPWGMLWIFFLIAIFIMLQKNAFGQKNFKFHARVQKCHFGNFSIFPKYFSFSDSRWSAITLLLWSRFLAISTPNPCNSRLRYQWYKYKQKIDILATQTGSLILY